MATEDNTNGSTTETAGQEQQGQQDQAAGGETPQQDQDQQAAQQEEPTKLPDDHPLVKTLAKQKQDMANIKTELSEARAKTAQVTKLEEELQKRPTTEALETLQTRYDRLEAFLVAAGGPLGKALDSRSFTRDLFESDKDIDSLVKEWHRANPSATSQALSGSAGGETSKKHDPNELLRIAAGKA